jgi:hypothetical protein
LAGIPFSFFAEFQWLTKSTTNSKVFSQISHTVRYETTRKMFQLTGGTICQGADNLRVYIYIINRP